MTDKETVIEELCEQTGRIDERTELILKMLEKIDENINNHEKRISSLEQFKAKITVAASLFITIFTAIYAFFAFIYNNINSKP